MRELWVQLSDHVVAWWAATDTPAAAKRAGSLPRLFMQRMAKSWHPAASPAFVLDPIYFKQRASGKWGPNFEAIQVRPSIGHLAVYCARHQQASHWGALGMHACCMYGMAWHCRLLQR